MKRAAKGTLLLAAGVVLGIAGSWQFAPRYDAPSPIKVADDLGMNRIVNAQFRATPFEQAVQSLSEQAHAPVTVHWDEVEAAGIDRRTPITLWVTQLPLHDALDKVLSEAGASTTKLTTYFDNGLVQITTDESASKQMLTREYDVRDLIEHLKPQAEKYRGQSFDECFNGTRPGLTGGESDEAVEIFIHFTQEVVAPASWRDAGGTVGSMRWIGGRLIVTQTYKNHLELEQTFQSMRESVAKAKS